MSLDPPAYIWSLQNNIRARPISWEGAVRARTITDSDLKQIKSIDKVRKEQRKQTIEGDLDGFCKLFLGGSDGPGIFQVASKREDIIQYLLVLLGDLIDDVPPFTAVLIKHSDPYKPLLPFLKNSTNPEDPIPLLTSSVLSSLIGNAVCKSSSRAPPHVEEAIPKLNGYLATLTASTDSGLQDIAVQEYSAILRSQTSRDLLWKQRQETINPLVKILRNAAGTPTNGDGESTIYNGASSARISTSDVGLSGGVSVQLLYHVLLVFWQLSFGGSQIAEGLDEEHDIVPLYVRLLRLSPKEKISRLIVSTLNNFLQEAKSTILPAATQARLPALLANLKGRHLTDQDLLDDIESLKSMLDEYSKSQTTFDEYATEVRSGHLRWSPPHRDANFWRENAQRILDENKGELPGKLAEILGKPWDGDRQVLAIGCNDVACLVREVPEKKVALEKLGLKARVMELMQTEDESVRWESLRAVGEWLRYSFNN